MLWHFSAYVEAVGTVTNSDIDAVADDVLQRRNSHLIFSEPYDLLAALPIGANVTRSRFGNVALTVRGNNHHWPLTRSATIPSRPRIIDRREMPLRLPMNEELTVEQTTDGPAMGTAQTACLLWLGKPGWHRNLPRGLDRFTTRATVVIAAGTETTWTALAAPTFERELFNGVYSVVGAHVVAANALAFRLFFPSQRVVEGRQHRPGGLVQDATGDHPWEPQMGGLGEWGRFHTFEPPSIQVLADAAGGTYEVRLELIYLGESQSLLRG